ncbi:DUF2019 domain-containing protein [Myxococcus sp. MISCRS1]|uniref:DUF2019 domain-containing protein n=1 Tax=Myxococcus TaxID=32 RepID=UPI001143D00F|nr:MULTISPECIES: DUF2019 domain-containing protein [unclassified Myxococcus]MBZ4400967.1 DUF2019 domain-containing protein [Myxococcus sp. AS-1-15]MBZ4409530.1 DUF2019 domain-containing protein [Myxococcus sp. XM-1-1-1]MCY1003078.1 DUF2019 domain-containing protein [Myxococcus sp. MISCRS1]
MKTPAKSLSLQALGALYAEAAAAHGAGSESGDYRATNAQFRRIDAAWRELRARGAEGTGVLASLMVSENPHVRGWAASHVLEAMPEAAEAVLGELANGPPGVARFNAEMVLKEWRAGSLKFD